MPLSILTQQVHAVGGWVIGPLSVRPVVLEYALQLERLKCPQFSDCSIPVPLTLIGLCRSRYTCSYRILSGAPTESSLPLSQNLYILPPSVLSFKTNL